jgi:tetratricopeptide (TPR) repeat protein
MFSIVISVAVSAALFLATKLRFDWLSGLVVGIVGGGVTFFLLLRRSRKQLEGSMGEIEGHVKAQRIEKAIAAIEALKPLGKWQPGLGGSLEGQIGMLRYAHLRDFEGARPHLERAHPRLWHAWAMLAAAHFKKERFDEMHAVFERAVKRNKSDAMLWLAYGYCEWKRNRRNEAISVLARGQTACPKDERIKHQLEALQNGKKMKMSHNDPEWLALHLEKTLVPPGQNPNRPRFMPPARRLGMRHMR